MSLEIVKHADVVETMENYLSAIRPEPKIRHKLDIDYEIQDQSVILNEIRPSWSDPQVIQKFGYAKATFVKSKNCWKIFWKRSDLKWHLYEPEPTVRQLNDFLKIVDEDKHSCFKG